VSRGRSYRDALRRLLDNEHFDRIIVSVPEDERSGLTHDDLLWLIDRVPRSWSCARREMTRAGSPRLESAATSDAACFEVLAREL
jgi:hypothetical protein